MNNNIKIKCADLGTRCDICNEVPKGFNNTQILTLNKITINICDACLDDLDDEINKNI